MALAAGDAKRAREAQQWMETVLGRKIAGSFMDAIKDGVLLCELLNTIKPGTVAKFKKSSTVFVCRNNIQIYLKGCRKLGVPDGDCFETRDLYDGQGPVRVINNIFSLSAATRKVAGFNGPYIGVAYAKENKREFSEETLAKGRNAVPGWSKGGIAHDLSSGHDSRGIVTVQGVQKHSGVQSKWEQGSIAQDTSSAHDSRGIVTVKGVQKHSGVQSKWEQGAIARDLSSGHDSRGIVSVKGMQKHSGVQSKWEKGAIAQDLSSGHDSRGIVSVKGMQQHSGVQSKWEQGGVQQSTGTSHDSYGVIRQPGHMKK